MDPTEEQTQRPMDAVGMTPEWFKECYPAMQVKDVMLVIQCSDPEGNAHLCVMGSMETPTWILRGMTGSALKDVDLMEQSAQLGRISQ